MKPRIVSEKECAAIREHLRDTEPEKWSGRNFTRMDLGTMNRLLTTIEELLRFAHEIADIGDEPDASGACALCHAKSGMRHAVDCLSERAMEFIGNE